MKIKQIKLQLVLALTGFLLFFLTYLYYPSINKGKILEDQSVEKDSEKSSEKDGATAFEDMEYKGLYDLDKPFTVKSKKAYILNEDPDVVYMTDMYVILYLSGDRIVEITSLSGRYNKSNYNCFFEENVRATDGETLITAKNLDLLATENFAEIYNDVYLDHGSGDLEADRINYNFETKNFKGGVKHFKSAVKVMLG